MTFRRGRLIDHVHLRASDFGAARQFYEAVCAIFWLTTEHSGEGWLTLVDSADADTVPTHVHLAFQARDEEMVKAFCDAALAAGGTDNGAPGARPYHPGYDAAFVLDPDGNNIETVHHGPARRSAPSVQMDA